MARSKCACGALAIEMVSGEFFCKSCVPRTAAEKVDIMSDIHIRPKEIIPVEIKNTGPGGCTCKPKKWWEKLFDYLGKSGPPGCG